MYTNIYGIGLFVFLLLSPPLGLVILYLVGIFNIIIYIIIQFLKFKYKSLYFVCSVNNFFTMVSFLSLFNIYIE